MTIKEKIFKNHGLILAISEYIHEDSEILKILNLNLPKYMIDYLKT